MPATPLPAPTRLPGARAEGRLHRAEQDLLLVRLAADTGARRGELVALQIADLDGRVLRIDKAVSAGVLTTPKSGNGRVLTLGATPAGLWHTLIRAWNDRAGQLVGPGCSRPPRASSDLSAPELLATGSTSSATPPASPTRPCTDFGTASRPTSSPTARSSKPRRG